MLLAVSPLQGPHQDNGQVQGHHEDVSLFAVPVSLFVSEVVVLVKGEITNLIPLLSCWPCVCIPCCMDSCLNHNHYCPSCDAYLGTYET